jgi:flagellar L-ring protein FlgH
MSRRFIALSLSLTLLSGCASTVDKLSNIGEPEPLTKMEDPTTKPDYRPMTWPLPEQPGERPQYAGSLWQPGSRSFFRDQRATRVGDIVRVNVRVQDRAQLDNQTTRNRTGSEELAAPKLFGAEALYGVLPGSQNPNSLLGLNSNSRNAGSGGIQRQERIETQIAATVVQILPNGNLVIDGSQEIRINSEVRELSVAGVIRPQDIAADNSIDSSQIAQARLSYGGRGQISDAQQPRWGQQAIDILSPF